MKFYSLCFQILDFRFFTFLFLSFSNLIFSNSLAFADIYVGLYVCPYKISC